MHDIDRTLVGGNYEAERAAYSEGEEERLISELMEVNSEEEFEGFLGDLISRAAKAVGGYISSQTGQSLGGLLKGAARQLLPVVQQALGSQETENESEMEEQEWEAAKTVVKLSTDAAQKAALAPPGADPSDVATKAVTDAARVHAPSLVAPPRMPMGGTYSGPPYGRPPLNYNRAGRWIRRGNHIILFGA
jgi:hypothetical protein